MESSALACFPQIQVTSALHSPLACGFLNASLCVPRSSVWPLSRSAWTYYWPGLQGVWWDLGCPLDVPALPLVWGLSCPIWNASAVSMYVIWCRKSGMILLMRKPTDLNHKPLEWQSPKPMERACKWCELPMMPLNLPSLFWLREKPKKNYVPDIMVWPIGPAVWMAVKFSLKFVTKTLENIPWMICLLLTHIWMLSKNLLHLND